MGEQSKKDITKSTTTLIGESGMITFKRHFKYLGSYIWYSLKDDYDIEHRISLASAAMGDLNNFGSTTYSTIFQNT